MGARYYQPNTGRFTQLDPLPCTIDDGQRYSYTMGNPANYIDPTGTHHVRGQCHWLLWGTIRKYGRLPARYYPCASACYLGPVAVLAAVTPWGGVWLARGAAALTAGFGTAACVRWCNRHSYGYYSSPDYIWTCGY